MDFTQSLSEWAKDKPLSILQLDPADRAVLKIADERDAIQKKTFTKWLNKHLKKHWRYLETYACFHVCYSCQACCAPRVNHHVEDLFEDLRDGNNLISLLEVLSSELLSRERGRMRFHQLQNVQMALEFLRNRNIRLVNIRPEDIVDGNPKLTLGLIWTIILHFQISDIITGMEDETVSAREALLKWAQRTTERYPGVKVTDFTRSWRDGLAFNAILHRNRPDLLDFKSLRARNAKDNLEAAFSLAEKEFGITRLLDAEDVDTPEPDEKSLITYISSLYDVFPDPPTHHPFADDEKNRKMEEYKELAKSLLLWMQESRNTFVNQKLFNNLIDMKNLLLESSKFRSNELPKRLRDKQRLSHLYRDIEKSSRHSIDDFPKDIRIEELEKSWDQTNSALQDRDQKIKDEICRLEKLQRLAEKFIRESKQCAGKIEDIEKRIFEEEKRSQRIRPDDLKHNCDQIKNDFKFIDDTLRELHKDLLVFQEKNYSQTTELQFRLDSLKERYKHLKEVFQSGLISLTEQSEKVIIEKKITKTKTSSNEKVSETNIKQTSSLKEHFDWIDRKHKRIQSLEFGNDYQTIKGNLDQIKVEQKTIEQYKKKIGPSNPQKNGKDTESVADGGDLETLQDKLNALVSSTFQKQQEFENLLDFVQSATRELKWMSDKEETEIARDWSAKNLNLNNLEHHQETLTNDLEKREIQFNAVQSRGESLLLQKHPASECIEEYLSKMQNQWSWLLQLTFCLEIHLRHVQVYNKFFKEARESEQWLKKTEEKLNTTFNKTAFSIDEGESYLKQMETLKDDLSKYNDTMSSFVNRASEVVPLKQRRLQPSKPIPIMAICNYKSSDVNILKGDKYVLKEISHRTWKVLINNSKESVIPSVCFVIPPPNIEATELAQSLKKRYDDLLTLWTQRQKKLRQNLIFATIKVVKSWDLTHLRSLDVAQRESILKALNSDALKLIKEGSESEPSLMKLKHEMEQCNILFDTLVKKISETESDKSPKSVERKLSDTILGLQTTLNEKEKFLKSKLIAPIVWDYDLLENSVIEHKDFDIELRGLEDQINEVVQAFKSLNKKTTALQMKYDTLVRTWDKIWENSNLYIEKLKTVEVGLNRLNEATQTVSCIEVKLASCNNLSSNLEDLQCVHDNLLSFQEDMQKSQNIIDDAQESSRKLKELMQRIRTKQTNHPDVNKFENDLKKLLVRWDSAKSQIVERLRSCGASYELLRTYKNKVEKDNLWISETTVKLNSLKTVKKMTTKEIEMTVEPSMNLYSSISEKNSSFEETNTLGARYIREAKIYDLRLKHYKESLEEEHPSLDASLQKSPTLISGVDGIENEIENLNQLYSSLMQAILDYLTELKEVFTAQQNEKWLPIISKAVPVSFKPPFIEQVSPPEQLPPDPVTQLKYLELNPVKKSNALYNLKQSVKSEMEYSNESDDFSSLSQTSYLPLSKKMLNENNLPVSVEDSYNYSVGPNNVVGELTDILNKNSNTELVLCEGKDVSLRTPLQAVNLLSFDKLEESSIVSLNTKEINQNVLSDGCANDNKPKLLYSKDTQSAILSPNCNFFLQNEDMHKNIIESVSKETINENYSLRTDTIIEECNESIQILQLPPGGWDLKIAINQNLFDPNTGLFTIPGTDRLLTFEETVKMEIINARSTNVIVPFSKQVVPLDCALEKNILDSTGCYKDKAGNKMSMQRAIEKCLIIFSELKQIETYKPISQSSNIPESYISFKTDEVYSTSQIDNFKIQEPNVFNASVVPSNYNLDYQNSYNASSDTTFWPRKNQNLLQKIPRRMLSPKDAHMEGFIDKNTADILMTVPQEPSLSCLSSSKKGDGDVDYEFANNNLKEAHGKIPDFQQGRLISIKEALEDKLIDDSGKLLVPVGCALSIDQTVSQGLYDMSSNKVIHPESGVQLTFEEALICDVINPYSLYTDPDTHRTMCISEAIRLGIFNPKTGEIVLSSGTISILEAFHKGLFNSAKVPFKCPSLLAFTFPTALQYGYIDIETREFISPILNERIPLQKALDTSKLLSIPFQPQREYFLLDDVISNKLIDVENFTFRNPVTGEIMDIREAMRSGILMAKPVRLTNFPYMLNTNAMREREFDHTYQGDTCVTNSSQICSSKMSFDTVLRDDNRNLDSKFLYDKMSKDSYVTTEPINMESLQPVSAVENICINKFSLSQLLSLYDDNSKMFIIPNVQESISFGDLVKKDLIDLDSMLYDDKRGNALTLRDAIGRNIIDGETGHYIEESTGKRANLIDAANLGRFAVSDNPYLSYVSSNSSNNLLEIDQTLEKTVAHRPTSLPLEYNLMEAEMNTVEDNCDFSVSKYSSNNAELLNSNEKCQSLSLGSLHDKYFSGKNEEESESPHFAADNQDEKIHNIFQNVESIHEILSQESENYTINKNLSSEQTVNFDGCLIKSYCDPNDVKNVENESNFQSNVIVMDNSTTRENLNVENIAHIQETEILSSHSSDKNFTESDSCKSFIMKDSYAREFIFIKKNLTSLTNNQPFVEEQSYEERRSLDVKDIKDEIESSEIHDDQTLNKNVEEGMLSSVKAHNIKKQKMDLLSKSEERDKNVDYFKSPLMPTNFIYPLPKNKNVFSSSEVLDCSKNVEYQSYSEAASFKEESALNLEERKEESESSGAYEDQMLTKATEAPTFSSVRTRNIEQLYQNMDLICNKEENNKNINKQLGYKERGELNLESNQRDHLGNADTLLGKESKLSNKEIDFSFTQTPSSATNDASSFVEIVTSDKVTAKDFTIALSSKEIPSFCIDTKSTKTTTEIATVENKPVEETIINQGVDQKHCQFLPKIQFKQTTQSLPEETISHQNKYKSFSKDTLSTAKSTISPGRESVSNVKENLSPIKATKKSLEETKSHARETKSPARENKSPARENKSPARENKSPARENKSPVRENKSPIKDNKSQIRCTKLPSKDLKLSTKETVSPVQGTKSPAFETLAFEKETIRFEKETITHRKNTISPEREAVTPVKEIPSPVVERISSAKETISPVKEIIATAKEPIITGKETISPAEENKLVVKEIILPAKKTKETISPAKETVSPIKETISSAEETFSFVKVSKSAAKETISPAKETSLEMEKVSSAKDTMLPTEELSVVKQTKSAATELSEYIIENSAFPNETSRPVKGILGFSKETSVSSKETLTHENKTVAPSKEILSSEKEITAPEKEITEPENETISFAKEAILATKETSELAKEVSVSSGKTFALIKKPSLPTSKTILSKKESKLLEKGTKSPEKVSKFFESNIKSTEKETKLFKKDTTSPVKETNLYTKETDSFEKDTKSPIREAESYTKETSKATSAPVKLNTAPAKESVSSEKEPKPHKKETLTFVKKNISPSKDTISPAEETLPVVKKTISDIKETILPMKQTKFPVVDIKSTVKQTKSPVRGTKSPLRETTSPVRETKSPFKETALSTKLTKSHVKGMSTPVYETKSDIKGTITPVKEIIASTKETISQVKERISPAKETFSFVKEVSSDIKQTSPLVKENKSHANKTKSPVKEMISAVKEIKSPISETKSFITETKSPIRDTNSAVKETESPAREIKSPIREGKSPIRETKSPVKEIKLPSKELKLHVKNTKSPVKELKLPEKEIKLPLKDTNSPVKQIKSSTIETKSLIEKTHSLSRQVESAKNTEAVNQIDTTTGEVKLFSNNNKFTPNTLESSTSIFHSVMSKESCEKDKLIPSTGASSYINNSDNSSDNSKLSSDMLYTFSTNSMSSTVISQNIDITEFRESIELKANYDESSSFTVPDTIQCSTDFKATECQIPNVHHVSSNDALSSSFIEPEICNITIKSDSMLLHKAMDSNLISQSSNFTITNRNEVSLTEGQHNLEFSVAVQENFKVCQDNTTQLNLWMKDVEEKLTDLGVIQGHLPSLQLQISTVKVLKEELESKQNLITTCLDQMRNLAQRGLEVLSKEEVNYLQKNLISLRTHYDSLLNECNRFLKRLTSAFEELQKYRSEVKTLKDWMVEVQQEFKRIQSGLGDLNALEKKSEHIRTFTSDVIAHQADLRFVTMAAQKFIDESQEYLKTLNTFRTNLPNKLPALKATESEIKSEVQEITTIIHNFLNEVNKFSDNYASICSKYRSYNETVEKAKIWISEVKKSSKKVIEEPVSDEPSAVQDQLNKAKLINMEVVGQSRLVENIFQAVKVLTDTLENCNIAPKDTKGIENTINSIQDDYSELHDRIACRIKELQIALIHSQDIQGGLDRFLKWLEETETKSLKFQNQPISLIIEKLESQVQEYKILKSDISNQKQSIEMLKSTAKEISTEANPKLAKKVDIKLKDISQRFDKISEKVLKRCQLLEEVCESVHAFEEMVKQFDEWCVSAFERIESTDDVHRADIDGFSSVIEYILNQRDSKKEDFDQLLKVGKHLKELKDVSDMNMVKDKIHYVEKQWKNLGDILMEKKQLVKSRSEQVAAYDSSRVKVLDWLLKSERDFEKLEPLAVDQLILKKQAAETMHLLKEHSDYSSTIEKLNHLGNSCDNLVRTHTSNGKVVSPTRKTSSPTRKSPSKSRSNDNFSMSPVKSQVSLSSPLSKVSSGFSSRSSTDTIGDLDDLTPVQHQLLEINDRYSLLRSKISDRNNEITSITEEARSFYTIIKVLLTYIDAKQKQLSKEGTSFSKDIIENKFKFLKEIEKEMLEKQSEIDKLKTNIPSMLSKRKGAKGTTEIQEELQTIVKKWSFLSTTIQENLNFLQNLKEYQDLQQLMKNWLAQKEKMFQVLGPIASEPRMVSSQVQQIQVMRDEFTSQNSFMVCLNELSNAIIHYNQSTGSSSVKITEQMDVIQHQWNDMSLRLIEREKSLETASGVAKDFQKNLNELKENLQQINEKFESYEEKGINIEILLKKLMEMEEELDKLRPLLADAFSVCEQLCDVISDSSSKTEIKYKVNILEKSYSTLRKKIENKKAEIESSLKEDKVFFKVCEDIQSWLNTTESSFSRSGKISGNISKLLKEIEEYELFYKKIMNKEHEVYLCLSKGSDMLTKTSSKQEVASMKGKLDFIKKQFEKIKKTAIDRHTSLRSCLENCKKYQAVVDTFVPWLKEKEESFKTLKLENLKRDLLNKQIKEVQIIKSELSVQYQVFQNIQQFGAVILSNCECDTEAIKHQLEDLKGKWKHLNNGILAKIQLLEDLSQVLFEYDERFRDVLHGVQRLEDKMCSHDTLDVSCDPMFLDRLKVLLQEATSMKDEINKLKKFSKVVIEKAGKDINSSEILKNLGVIESRHLSLKTNLEERYTSFSASYKVISVFKDQIKTLRSELSTLDECFDRIRPIARDLKILKDQLNETKELKSNLLQSKKKYSTSKKMYEDMTKQDHTVDTKIYMEQINNMSRQILRLEEHITEREITIQTMITRVENFYSMYSDTEKKVKSLLKKEESFEAVVGDVETIRNQQQKFKNLHSAEVVPLSKQIIEVNKIGHGLVQSVTNGVDTTDIEQRIEELNSTWNSLQESINEKEKKLDVALLQSGKLQEALSGVQKWLIDTEEMVASQKKPSFDFKVVKAQVEEQKFLKKMLLDRHSSVMALKTMETEIVSTTKTTELEQAEKLMKSITSRFDELITTSENRMTTLETIVPVAHEFQNIYTPFTEWIETVEKRLNSMSSIPVEESRIKYMIAEQKKVSTDITAHGTSLRHLNDISEKLKQNTDSVESKSLQQKVQSVNEKFTEVKSCCENAGSLLHEAQKGIGNFTTSYTKVLSFIEETSLQLTRFQVLSIYSEKLQRQLKDLQNLKEKLNTEHQNIERVVESGEKIMKFASGDDSIQMKEKLDILNVKLTEASNKLNDRLKTVEISLPLVESFNSSFSKLTSWMDSLENSLKIFDSNALDVQRENIKRMQEGISQHRSTLDSITHNGSRLCQLSSGEGAIVIENQMSQANLRFEKLCEQVQRKAERIELSLQRKFDVINDIDELSDWFQEIEKQVTEAEGLSSEPNSLTVLLKEQKSLCEELNGQKTRVRDVISSAKRLMRESSSEDLSFIHEKMEELKSHSSNVSTLCQERLSTLEHALSLAQHFFETHTDLGQWLDEAEGEAELLESPALNSVQIRKQQGRNKDLTESVQEHKPLVDKLNKTGSALTKLCKEDESNRLEVILESDNSRYNALRKILREHQNALEEALQATSQFSDKLEGILNALTSTADQLHNAEPISAHPERIQEQINDNKAVLQDLDKRTITLEAVKKAADDVITKASTIDEPAVKDIKLKLDRLNDLWVTIQTAAHNRGKSLEEALIAAERFWDELTSVMKALKELQSNLNCQEPPAVEPTVVHQQQEVLLDIKQEISQTKPEVDHCRQAGQNLMQLCGEPDKPDVQKHIEDLDSVWENVTTLYAKREQNLVDAMEKAMVFHDTLQNLLEFLDTSEDKFSKFGDVSSDIVSVKEQMNQLKNFKVEVDPHMIEVEALNRQAQELMERTSSDQSISIREPLIDINRRWDDLLKCIVDRQREMENTLLKLGQFQHTLEEHLIWMTKTEKSLDELKPVYGDPQVIEIVLAKHKVISNDIQAHQSSIDVINRAGHEFLSSDRSSEDAKSTHNKLQNLQVRWQQLQDKSAEQYSELEAALREAQQFHQDIQDLLLWLNETDAHLVTTKPVGGLPETAKEQLNKFMDLYNELDTNRYKVEDILQQGQNYLRKSGESSTKTLQHSLRTLKQKWDSVLNKASDRKIKLEIALREAMEFHEALQTFVGWLTNAEKYLTGLKPVSRHMKVVLEQIEEHRVFQKDLGVHREVMLNLDKKGTHLKYFSQKQDVILIKNLLISVQHRWEKVVSKAAERTRALDHGYKESKEFHDAYGALSLWLDEAEKILDGTTPIGNDPTKIKKMLSKHKEFQRTLGSKQVTYDSTMKIGRILKERCPKQDVQLLQNMMDELKTRWNKICSKSVNRQRNLEEALLHSGQFKEAVLALMDWFDKAIKALSEIKPYHGDLDTVTSLIEQHKGFEEELKNRGLSLDSVCKSSDDLKKQASPSDAESISAQVEELNGKWKTINDLSEKKKSDLSQALQLAEKLYKMVHILLEWLSDAEMKLRFFGSLPEDEESTRNQIADQENFMKEMEDKEILKNSTLELAHDIIKKCHPDGLSVIRHWITILQSRWDEISTWAKQRDQRLRDHLLSLKDINDLLEELLAWLNKTESSLTALEAEPLPDDLIILDNLIKEHQIIMTDMSKRQGDVDRISKAFSSKRQQNKGTMSSQIKEKSKDKVSRSGTPVPLKTSTPIRPQNESDIKHPRARLLLEKWRIVWLLAMERQRRLQDRRNYLLELDRIKHFDFNDWRKRYLSWLNNKKSRIMDQFKKIDKNNVGKVTKQEFIDGILRSKFATSHLEMERVADIFDRNGDGFIDSKEYIETLRPERESGPLTEAEKIQDEVQRQVAKCTCVHRFKVYQVGEGKYRFGDSQKLRLVRILRSTVMVRVGGGWVALDEFLVKNDPCRAKGRTNLELREQFILADGVSQSMAPFKPKPSPNSSVSSQGGTPYSIPSAGPITKIREKSERSTPMRQSCSSVENSSDVSGPSFSETDSFNRSGNMRVTPPSSRLSSRNAGYKSSSRPTSRQGSQSSSRVPSDLSQDGIEEFKTKHKQTIAGSGINPNLSKSSSHTKSSRPESSKIPSVKKSMKQPSKP